MNLILEYPIFRGYVIFREGIGDIYSATIAVPGGQQGDEPSGAFDEALGGCLLEVFLRFLNSQMRMYSYTIDQSI